jgi:hypothetical protein
VAEATGRVTEADAEAPRDPQPFEADIVRRRAELTRLMGELTRRGHELTNVGPQIRRHALGVTSTVLAAGAIIGGWIALKVWTGAERLLQDDLASFRRRTPPLTPRTMTAFHRQRHAYQENRGEHTWELLPGLSLASS